MSADGELICVEVVEIATEYVEGALDEVTVKRVETHLAGCDGCRTFVAQIRETIAALGELPDEPLSTQTRERVLVAFADWRRE